MKLPSTLFLLLLSATLVFGQFRQRDRTTGRLQKGDLADLMEERSTLTGGRQQRSVSSLSKPECQEGNPLGASYSGSMSRTTSGRACQAWSGRNGEGEHSFCRNPNENVLGVWCYTTDPNMELELCPVPLCSPTYDCQEGDPLGATYQGSMNVTSSGRTCQAWSAQEPHAHGTPWVGDHNYCRINNPTGGVRCITTDSDKRWEFCDVPICAIKEQKSPNMTIMTTWNEK